MGTTFIWSIVGHYYTSICPVPVQTSTPEMVDQGIAVLRLLKGSLGWAKIVGGIAMSGYVCGQPRRLNLLGLLALSSQLLYNVPSSEGRDVGLFVSHPRYCHRKNLIYRLFCRHLIPWLGWWQWLTPEDGGLFSLVVSLSWMTFFLGLGVLRPATYGNWKPLPLRWGPG